jgi:hypothetical protein
MWLGMKKARMLLQALAPVNRLDTGLARTKSSARRFLSWLQIYTFPAQTRQPRAHSKAYCEKMPCG